VRIYKKVDAAAFESPKKAILLSFADVPIKLMFDDVGKTWSKVNSYRSVNERVFTLVSYENTRYTESFNIIYPEQSVRSSDGVCVKEPHELYGVVIVLIGYGFA
jgi:hypothetical protein